MFEKIKKRFLKDKKFFREDGEGYIFYPWIYPCEGIKLKKDLAFKISSGLFLYQVGIVLHGFGTILLRRLDVIGPIASINSFLLFCTLWPAVYFLFIKFLVKNKKLVFLGGEDRKLNWQINIYFLWIFFQVTSLFKYYGYANPAILAIAFAAFVYASTTFILILVTRGHIYSRK